jgi:hypothetical protein
VLDADRVCSRYEDQVEAEAKRRFDLGPKDVRIEGSRVIFRAGHRPSDDAIAQFATEVALPSLRSQVEELRGLTPPAGERARVDAIYAAASEGNDRLAADPAVLADQAASRALFANSTRLARRFGMTVCGL